MRRVQQVLAFVLNGALAPPNGGNAVAMRAGATAETRKLVQRTNDGRGGPHTDYGRLRIRNT